MALLETPLRKLTSEENDELSFATISCRFNGDCEQYYEGYRDSIMARTPAADIAHLQKENERLRLALEQARVKLITAKIYHAVAEGLEYAVAESAILNSEDVKYIDAALNHQPVAAATQKEENGAE